MTGLYDGLEETAFKRIDGGYIFQSRNPWLFGPSHHYVVTEAQKNAIAGRIRDTLREVKPMAFGALVIMPILIFGGTALLMLTGRATPVAIIALMLAVFGPYIWLLHMYSMRKLRPLITNLPRTSERITFREGTAKFNAHMPRKLLLLFSCCTAVGFVANLVMVVDSLLEGHLLRSMPFTLLAVILSGLATIYFGKIMFDRAKLKRNTG
jgi:hypothetical protein